MNIIIQYWPLLERVTDSEGNLIRSGKGYRRTKEPGMDREVEVLEFVSAARVQIYFGTGDSRLFSLRTGRGVQLPDWIIRKDSLRALRDKARELFPEEVKALDKALKALCGSATPAEALSASASPANDVAG
jgi:hypothetical protein